MLPEHELNELETLLATFGGEEHCLPLDGLHGYLTALAIDPDPPSIATWSAWALDPCGLRETPSEDSPEFRRAQSLLARLFASVMTALDDPDYHFTPLVRVYPADREQDEEHADGGAWCAGFLRGVAQGSPGWQAFARTAEGQTRMWPILRLADPMDEPALVLDPSLREGLPSKRPSASQRETLTENLPHTLEALADALIEFELPALMQAMENHQETPAWRPGAPCPCGSGKEFALCCGSAERILH